MKKFLEKIKKKANKNPITILFPESENEKILKASIKILEENLGFPILLGDKKQLDKKAKELNLGKKWKQIKIINHLDSKYINRYAKTLVDIRKEKKLTLKQAKELLKYKSYFATMMLQHNEVDAVIAGATWTTAETMRPALQILRTNKQLISTYFLMIKKDSLLVFADSAININPTANELATIAIQTADTIKKFNIEPKVGMLSFSTNGSSDDKNAIKVKKATKLANKLRPDLLIEGEMQLDCAINPETATIKYPNSKIKGKANVLIFPDLNAGNIGYKLVQELGKYKAIGPITQGLDKVINDLSRGCSIEDIVNLAAISSIEVSNKHYPWEK